MYAATASKEDTHNRAINILRSLDAIRHIPPISFMPNSPWSGRLKHATRGADGVRRPEKTVLSPGIAMGLLLYPVISCRAFVSL